MSREVSRKFMGKGMKEYMGVRADVRRNTEMFLKAGGCVRRARGGAWNDGKKDWECLPSEGHFGEQV